MRTHDTVEIVRQITSHWLVFWDGNIQDTEKRSAPNLPLETVLPTFMTAEFDFFEVAPNKGDVVFILPLLMFGIQRAETHTPTRLKHAFEKLRAGSHFSSGLSSMSAARKAEMPRRWRFALAAIFALGYFFLMAHMVSSVDYRAPDAFQSSDARGLLVIGALICGAIVGWQIGSASRVRRAIAEIWLLWPLAVFGWTFTGGGELDNPFLVFSPPLFVTIAWLLYRWVIRAKPE